MHESIKKPQFVQDLEIDRLSPRVTVVAGDVGTQKWKAPLLRKAADSVDNRPASQFEF
jgi:hypothetical protein